MSHDRAFLNNVVTSTLAFEGNGVVKEYDGGYDDFVRQRGQLDATESEVSALSQSAKPQAKPASKPVKLTYKEQKALDAIPEQISTLEAELSDLHEQMADPEFFKQDGSILANASTREQALNSQLETLFARWEELEGRQTS